MNILQRFISQNFLFMNIFLGFLPKFLKGFFGKKILHALPQKFLREMSQTFRQSFSTKILWLLKKFIWGFLWNLSWTFSGIYLWICFVIYPCEKSSPDSFGNPSSCFYRKFIISFPKFSSEVQSSDSYSESLRSSLQKIFQSFLIDFFLYIFLV